jgi:hypothetical protein
MCDLDENKDTDDCVLFLGEIAFVQDFDVWIGFAENIKIA